MNSQQEKANTLRRLATRLEALSRIDLLGDHLEALSRMKSAEILRLAGGQDYSHHLLEEAEAAYSQVATLLDGIHQELVSHHQRFEEVQEQQSKQQSR
jgi:hypothetical protein